MHRTIILKSSTKNWILIILFNTLHPKGDRGDCNSTTKSLLMKRVVLSIVASIFLQFISFQSNAQEDTLTNSEGLIKLIYQTYSKNWYPHLTFKQEMFRYKNDSLVSTEIWIEAYSAPSRWHIRYQDFDTGRGWLIVNDSIYTYNHNKLIGKRPRVHELMILGLDIYIVSPEIVISRIIGMNFDMSYFTTTTKNGKQVYQIGNPDKQCFWVEKGNLLFYGMRKVGESGVKETFFEAYKIIYDKPVATQIQSFENGKLVLFEKYFDIRLPSCLPEEFFEPANFATTRW